MQRSSAGFGRGSCPISGARGAGTTSSEELAYLRDIALAPRVAEVRVEVPVVGVARVADDAVANVGVVDELPGGAQRLVRGLSLHRQVGQVDQLFRSTATSSKTET